MVIQACQLLCFPFALDVDGDTLSSVVAAVRDSQLPAQLLQVPPGPALLPVPCRPLSVPSPGSSALSLGQPSAALFPPWRDEELSAAVSPFSSGLLSPSAAPGRGAAPQPLVPPRCV